MLSNLMTALPVFASRLALTANHRRSLSALESSEPCASNVSNQRFKLVLSAKWHHETYLLIESIEQLSEFFENIKF